MLKKYLNFTIHNLFSMKKRNKNRGVLSNHEHSMRRTPLGASPGYLNIADDALMPRIFVYFFSSTFFEEKQVSNFHELQLYMKKYESQNLQCWIDIRGLGDRELLESLGSYLSIHRLEMEDVVNAYQRPKIEEYDNHLFLISRMIFRRDEELHNEQLAFFLAADFLVTFQEHYEDVLDPVRERLRKGKGQIRTAGLSYVSYAIMDVIVDNYFPILEQIGDRLDVLEDELLSNPDVFTMQKIQMIKKELIILRRSIWPERDKINSLIRLPTEMISADSKIFYRDIYDHSIQLLDLIESYKEVTASMMDIYLSSVSNKMNQIMKVLTIISTIFIPLTFIVGVYGMNFSRTDPNTGKVLVHNMPELYSAYGYPAVLGGMLFIVILLTYYFYRRGWITKKF